MTVLLQVSQALAEITAAPPSGVAAPATPATGAGLTSAPADTAVRAIVPDQHVEVAGAIAVRRGLPIEIAAGTVGGFLATLTADESSAPSEPGDPLPTPPPGYDALYFGYATGKALSAPQLVATAEWRDLNDIMRHDLLGCKDGTARTKTLAICVAYSQTAECWQHSGVDWMVHGVAKAAAKYGLSSTPVFVATFVHGGPCAALVFHVQNAAAGDRDGVGQVVTPQPQVSSVFPPRRACRHPSFIAPPVAHWQCFAGWAPGRPKVPTDAVKVFASVKHKIRLFLTRVVPPGSRVLLSEPGFHHVLPELRLLVKPKPMPPKTAADDDDSAVPAPPAMRVPAGKPMPPPKTAADDDDSAVPAPPAMRAPAGKPFEIMCCVDGDDVQLAELVRRSVPCTTIDAVVAAPAAASCAAVVLLSNSGYQGWARTWLPIVDCWLGSGGRDVPAALAVLSVSQGAEIKAVVNEVQERARLHHYSAIVDSQDAHTLCSLRYVLTTFVLSPSSEQP